MRGVVPLPTLLIGSKSGIFLLDALVGGGVCIEAADLAESTVPGPSSPTVGNGLTGRVRRTVSVCSDSLASFSPAVSPARWASVFSGFEGWPRANFWGERRNSGLEAYGSAVSQVTRGSKKLDSSLGVKESRAAVVGVLVGV